MSKIPDLSFLPVKTHKRDRQADIKSRHQSAKATDRQFDAERTSIFVFGQTTGVVSCFTALH